MQRLDIQLNRETTDSKGQIITEALRGEKQLPPTTVDFVLSFVAVFLAVTFPEDGDAKRGSWAAAELVKTARPHVCRQREHGEVSDQIQTAKSAAPKQEVLGTCQTVRVN